MRNTTAMASGAQPSRSISGSNAGLEVVWWPISRPKPYPKNARKWSQSAVEKVASSIKSFGWVQPIVCDRDDVIVIGHLRLAAAHFLGLTEVPVYVASNLSPAQIKALRIADNRTHEEADWIEDLLSQELLDLKSLDFDLGLTGFDSREISALIDQPNAAEDEVPPLPITPVSRPGDLWLLGDHRVLCGDCTDPATVTRLLAGCKPCLMVTDPPYGIELDSEWRDRAGINQRGPAQASYMKQRSEGHTETTISGDTIADWSHAFELVPSVQVAYVWHASRFTSDVLHGLLRIAFLHHQQIIWRKTVAALTRTHYWFQHEPCWYVRKKNAPWFGKPGENTTIWDAASPKMIMGGSDEEKYDHPTQKPVELMRRPILNHTQPGELVYEPFLGSGTTLAAAELTGRVCLGLELDPKYVDVVVMRWQSLSGKAATLDGDGRSFEEIGTERGQVRA